MTIKILVRNLPIDKTNADYEVVELKKVPEGETFEEQDWGEVLSVYNNSDASSTHYRIRGIQNSYYRKAKDCNNVTFTDSDRVFAHLKAIKYEIPEEGVPERDVLRYTPYDDKIGGIIKPAGYTVHLASGKCCFRYGQETGDDERWVESVSITREDTATYAWIKFTHDDKFYILDYATQQDEMALLREIDTCRRDRLALKVVVSDVRPILPVLWVNDEVEALPVEISQVMDKTERIRHGIVFATINASSEYFVDIQNRVGEGYKVGKIISAIASADNDVYLELKSPFGNNYYIQTTFDKLEGGWNLRSDLQTHRRSFSHFYVAFTLEEDVRKAEEEKKRASAPETVIWSAGKTTKAKLTGTYVTAVAVPVQMQADYRKGQLEDHIRRHMAMLEQHIPGLKWEEVEEVRGNWDVVVSGSIIQGTSGAKEYLARQMTGDINTVLVGIINL